MIDTKIEGRINAAVIASLLCDYMFRANSNELVSGAILEKHLFDELDSEQKDEYDKRIEHARRLRAV